MWRCVSTVTTVKYGEIVRISNLGKIVAIFYMFFGIAMRSPLISVITSTFYKLRYEKDEGEKREQELDQLMRRLSDIEENQRNGLDLINELK